MTKLLPSNVIPLCKLSNVTLVILKLVALLTTNLIPSELEPLNAPLLIKLFWGPSFEKMLYVPMLVKLKLVRLKLVKEDIKN